MVEVDCLSLFLGEHLLDIVVGKVYDKVPVGPLLLSDTVAENNLDLSIVIESFNLPLFVFYLLDYTLI